MYIVHCLKLEFGSTILLIKVWKVRDLIRLENMILYIICITLHILQYYRYPGHTELFRIICKIHIAMTYIMICIDK